MIFKSSKKMKNKTINDLLIEQRINEGLITSYEFRKCEKYLRKKFPFINKITMSKLHPIGGRGLTSDEASHYYFIKINSNFEDYLFLEKTLNNLCGWYISKATVYYKDTRFNNPNLYISEFDNLEGGLYDVEEKHFLNEVINKQEEKNIKIYSIEFLCQEKFTENVKDIPDVLYHGTFSDKIYRIRKYGLEPMEKGSRPNRIYFGKSERVVRQLTKYDKDIVLLRVKIDDKIKNDFWVDFNHKDCYYTKSHIHPKYIQVYEEGEWIDLV